MASSTLRPDYDAEMVDPLEELEGEGIDDDADEDGLIRPQNEAAAKWLKGRYWVNNPDYEQANLVLAQIGAELVNEDGFSPDEHDYYREVERRMNEMFPGLLQGDRQLSPEDRRNMKRFGLDPKNKQHAREYAKAKRGR